MCGHRNLRSPDEHSMDPKLSAWQKVKALTKLRSSADYSRSSLDAHAKDSFSQCKSHSKFFIMFSFLQNKMRSAIVLAIFMLLSIFAISDSTRRCGKQRIGMFRWKCVHIPHNFFGIEVDMCAMNGGQCTIDDSNTCRCMPDDKARDGRKKIIHWSLIATQNAEVFKQERPK